jgi:hypothetical protein
MLLDFTPSTLSYQKIFVKILHFLTVRSIAGSSICHSSGKEMVIVVFSVCNLRLLSENFRHIGKAICFFEVQQISSNDTSNFKVSKLHHRNTADVESTYVYIGFTAA